MMQRLGHQSHSLAHISAAEILTMAVVVDKYFANNHARALQVLYGMRHLAKPLNSSRFNRRLHAPGGWLWPTRETSGALFAVGEAFLLDSMPVPACRRARPPLP